jgi:hypothetical protein
MWKKKGKKSNSNDRREKQNILRKPIDKMTQTSETNKVLCWKHSEREGKNSQRGSHCKERNGTEQNRSPSYCVLVSKSLFSSQSRRYGLEFDFILKRSEWRRAEQSRQQTRQQFGGWRQTQDRECKITSTTQWHPTHRSFFPDTLTPKIYFIYLSHGIFSDKLKLYSVKVKVVPVLN